ncbi:protein of unknown function [Sphingobacterium nematocida]|uniref:Zinc-dependent metalloprotease n=1 Tax=Sphingobacterium nematocida TaxID=1513896 RepID=A0A1T5AU39_9SPHI|nr:zinc-dependent metalloprotease [Sphingobacterium nematocida]SKB38551.1 protein of unknown function [Sphingobacterium nematocida]
MRDKKLSTYYSIYILCLGFFVLLLIQVNVVVAQYKVNGLAMENSGHVLNPGFFTLAKQKDRFLLSIPDSIFGRDIAMVTRISKITGRYGAGQSGVRIRTRMVQFKLDEQNRVYISYLEESVYPNIPVKLGDFNARAGILYRDSVLGITTIDFSDFIQQDLTLIGGNGGKFMPECSEIIDIQGYGEHMDIQFRGTYVNGPDKVSEEYTTSFSMLPKKPMKVRYEDKRIGYFTQRYPLLDTNKTNKKNVITRFRLEPKPADITRYLQGELVEPQKPIVFYIDPTTPEKYVQYIIQGINDWQEAFEKAGFKNAIYGQMLPTDTVGVSIYDAKHSAVVYMPFTGANAKGERTHDPRSGEIMEGHVEWYHNILTNFQEWYMIQAGPNDPAGRKVLLDDEIMGRMIRRLTMHEVGHSLGLRHNFIASSSIPVDSLRSVTYLKENGISHSIMEYCRFNYVAQPEDNIPTELLGRHIGIYDKWAIAWGYRWFPEDWTAEQEQEFLQNWATDELSKDKRLFSVVDFLLIPDDARVLIEDLGDDAIKASTYGIKNLKIVMENLEEWTKSSIEDFNDLHRMTLGLFAQYDNYLGHVAHTIRLGTDTTRFKGDQGLSLGYVPKDKRKSAVEFLETQLFDTPSWLLHNTIARKTGLDLHAELKKSQQKVLDNLISDRAMKSLKAANLIAPVAEQYTFEEMLLDIQDILFEELNTAKPISANRQFLQASFIDQIMSEPTAKFLGDRLQKQIAQAVLKFKEPASRRHLQALQIRIQSLANPEVLKAVIQQRQIRQEEQTHRVMSAYSCCEDRYEINY